MVWKSKGKLQKVGTHVKWSMETLNSRRTRKAESTGLFRLGESVEVHGESEAQMIKTLENQEHYEVKMKHCEPLKG